MSSADACRSPAHLLSPGAAWVGQLRAEPAEGEDNWQSRSTRSIDVTVPSNDGASISLSAVGDRPLRDDEAQLFDINAKLGMYMHALDTDRVDEAPVDRVPGLEVC